MFLNFQKTYVWLLALSETFVSAIEKCLLTHILRYCSAHAENIDMLFLWALCDNQSLAAACVCVCICVHPCMCFSYSLNTAYWKLRKFIGYFSWTTELRIIIIWQTSSTWTGKSNSNNISLFYKRKWC